GAKATVPLPGTVRDVCVGGGGRYLLLHVPQHSKLAVFDCREAKVVKYLPVAEGGAYFAAGLDKLFVGLPSRNQIQRWDLTTFECEATAPAPVPLRGLAMGSAAREPLVVQTRGGGLFLLDPGTLQKSDCGFGADNGTWEQHRARSSDIHVS